MWVPVIDGWNNKSKQMVCFLILDYILDKFVRF